MMAEILKKENIFADSRNGNGDESDVDEFFAALSRQMAQSYLDDDDTNPKILMATPPQPALHWFRSSYRNSDGPSHMSYPLLTSSEPKKSEEFRDFSYSAAGDVVRSSGWYGKPNRNECHPILNPVHIQQQLQIVQLLRLKRELLLRQHLAEVLRRQNGARSRSVGVGHGIGVPSSARPRMQKPHQHPQALPGSGMRAVFINGSGSRRESTGTGVFLPRHIGPANEPKSKPVCSTVLLPERVVQALNLDLNDLGLHSCVAGSRIHQGNSMAYHEQDMSSVSPDPTVKISSNEIHLPQEWTY